MLKEIVPVLLVVLNVPMPNKWALLGYKNANCANECAGCAVFIGFVFCEILVWMECSWLRI